MPDVTTTYEMPLDFTETTNNWWLFISEELFAVKTLPKDHWGNGFESCHGHRKCFQFSIPSENWINLFNLTMPPKSKFYC